MKTSESTEITTKLIPKLVDECNIPIENIKTDCSTKKTKNKRVDILVSQVENNCIDFEDKLITIIEVKQESAKLLNIYDESGNIKSYIKELLEENYNNYEFDSKNINSGTIEEKDWFNALVQGYWKAKKLNLDFFAVSNIKEIVFYHTNTLKPLIIKKTVSKFDSENNKIVNENIEQKMTGFPTYSLLRDLKRNISKKKNICDFTKLTIEEKKEKDSMSEQDFNNFLSEIHDEFYKKSLQGSKKYLGDIILTFIFFKYLEERITILGKEEKYNKENVLLWSKWISEDELKDKENAGLKIFEVVERELSKLNNTDDIDSEGNYSSGYEKEYREFSKDNILVYIGTLPKNRNGYEFVLKIYNGLNGVDLSNNQKKQSLYLHSCNFDVYGAIYEKFKDKSEKKELGQYYTKRHISRVLANLTLRPVIKKINDKIDMLKEEKEQHGDNILPIDIVNIIKEEYEKVQIIDPSCGTGGLLTECYSYLSNEYRKILNARNQEIDEILSKSTFTGIDTEDDCIKKAKLNMFFAGDGHTQLYCGSSLEPIIGQKIRLEKECEKNKWNILISNPPYGKRKEYKFVKKYIDAIPYNGRIGIIIPNGILENTSEVAFRKMIISNIKIESIISLNEFVFAPYTKQKTYMLIGYKRSKSMIEQLTNGFINNDNQVDYNIENNEFDNLLDRIWCYILDFDGYNLSDNRWKTDLVDILDGKPYFLHNDIPEVIDYYLQKEIIKKNQINIDGTLMGEKQEDGDYLLNKSKFIYLNKDIIRKNHYNLLPEFYMRPYKSEIISLDEMEETILDIESDIRKLISSNGIKEKEITIAKESSLCMKR